MTINIDYSLILSTKFAGEEWTLEGDDYEGLTWLSSTQKPTKKELDDLWPIVETEIEEQKQAKAQAKAAAEAKLEALGLTPEELKALGL